MCSQVKAVFFSKGVAGPGIPPRGLCVARGMKARAVASLSLPTCATTLGKSDLTEVATASTRGSSDWLQLLVWLLQGNFYIMQSYRASDAHLVTAGAPLMGRETFLPLSLPQERPPPLGLQGLGGGCFAARIALFLLYFSRRRRRRRGGKLLISRGVKMMLWISARKFQKNLEILPCSPSPSSHLKELFLVLCCSLVSVCLLIL